MNKDEARQLIGRFLDGTASGDEIKLVDRWYVEESQKKDWQVNDDEVAHVIADMWSSIDKATRPVKQVTFWPRWAAAASVFLILTAGIYFSQHFLYKGKTKTQSTVIIPGSNKAVLTINGNKNIVLTGALTGLIARGEHVAVTKTVAGGIRYIEDKHAGAVPLYHTLTTPAGGQFQITLSDGTLVWLNSGSSIHYPEFFTGKTRDVAVTGEVYFEVAHNAAFPFKVQTPTQAIEVLGTHFNINAYQDEPVQKTTLLEGRVKVTLKRNGMTAQLFPGQQVQETADGLNVKSVGTDDVVAWTNGYFQFSNESLESIMRKISRWYNVTVTYDGDFSGLYFGGIVSRSKSIDEALNVMQSTNNVHFKIEGRRIIVTK